MTETTRGDASEWRRFIESGRTLRLEVDQAQLTRTLARNTRYLAVTGGATGVVGALIVALAVTGAGREFTILLLAVLVMVMLGNVGLGMLARRRVRRALAVEGVFLEIGVRGVQIAGIPFLAWSDLLGVVFSDIRSLLSQGGWWARTVRRLQYGIGGALVYADFGVDDLRSVKAAAAGPRTAALTLAGDGHGGAQVQLDVALAPEQCDQVREALRASTVLNDVPFLVTNDQGVIARAALQMGRGERLTVG